MKSVLSKVFHFVLKFLSILFHRMFGKKQNVDHVPVENNNIGMGDDCLKSNISKGGNSDDRVNE